ncbi:hypothetical protein [Arthrobacter sp. SDTb3-6]|uniref:hypothetical protein n=1 Tax=Arthrobacter sp. SDTb3-6 TaxID=2713571 RepID=UPI00159D9A0A|nr:hypothetical protein [Arthrobacter sp. SDTb3-6]NVN00692.1 hypothetical protein [Arthrobacter sp. SDTb3-6]
MNTNEITLWVQAGAVVVAVGASIVALVVSTLDRRNARWIAAEDRRAALGHAQLMFEQEALLRLLQNLRRGGHTDSVISKDMGAEAGALISAVGPEKLPRNWAKQVAQTESELLAYVDDEEQPDWQRRAVEAHIALNDVTRDIRERIAAGAKA